MGRHTHVSAFRWLASAVALGGVLGLLYLVQTRQVAYFEVTSESMEPTLMVGSRLIMVQPKYYEPLDIVVVPKPGAPQSLMVKRLVAVGPARVELREGLLYVNGQRSDPPQGVGRPVDLEDNSWIVSEQQGFVVGDNRANSYDSRDFGPVMLSDLKGVAMDSNLLEYMIESFFLPDRLQGRP